MLKLFPVVCCYGWQGWMRIETWRIWANIFMFQCHFFKNHQTFIMVWGTWPNFVWYLHHDFAEALFVWVKVLPIIISERGWGRENQRGRGGSGLFFYIIWVGHFWNIKWKGVGCIFFYYIETHKGRKIIVILNLLQWIFGFPFFNKVRFLIINITK